MLEKRARGFLENKPCLVRISRRSRKLYTARSILKKRRFGTWDRRVTARVVEFRKMEPKNGGPSNFFVKIAGA